MLRLIAVMMALLAGTGVAAVGYGLQAAAAGDAGSGGGNGGRTPAGAVVTIDVGIQHSRFTPEVIRVPRGSTVRFVVHNADPIRHEFIVGPDEVHLRHASGREGFHPPVPGEVTVDPGAVAETTYHFAAVAPMEFACHLPAHYEYGMHGQVEVY